jgi:hypothetical protein
MYKIIPFSERILLSVIFISIVYSFYLFFIKGDVYTSIFIGLWAPTVMGIVNYINLKFNGYNGRN